MEAAAVIDTIDIVGFVTENRAMVKEDWAEEVEEGMVAAGAVMVGAGEAGRRLGGAQSALECKGAQVFDSRLERKSQNEISQKGDLRKGEH